MLEGLLTAANFTMDTVGLGPHSLLRLCECRSSHLSVFGSSSDLTVLTDFVAVSSDWDDGFQPPPTAEPVAESVLTSALAAYVLPRWGALLRSLPPSIGRESTSANLQFAAQRAERFGEGLRVAILRVRADIIGHARINM